MTWKEMQLGEAIRLKRGHDLPASERKAGNIPIISSSGVTGYHNASKAQGPGVVTGRYGTLGEVHYIEGDYWPLNTALYVEDFKENHPRFVAYLLSTLSLGSQNTAGAVPGLNRNTLHLLPIRIPGAEQQINIAGILVAYDDLIQANLRRIGLLEEAARLIYRECFVHLRFPGHEHVRVVDGVPEGWKRSSLDSVASYVNRGIAPKYAEDSLAIIINQKCIRNFLVDLEPSRPHDTKVPADKLIRQWDVLVNSTGTGTLGRVAQVRVPVENITVDTHVTIVRPSGEMDPHFFGLAIESFQPYFQGLGQGATNQAELQRDRIKEALLLVPPPDVQAEFGRLVGDMRKQSTVLVNQNKLLQSARDLLLPRLMSGSLEVP